MLNNLIKIMFCYRYMFKTDPDIMVKYPFYQDEWNKISYADYSGTYTDQPPNNWFLVFRSVMSSTHYNNCASNKPLQLLMQN